MAFSTSKRNMSLTAVACPSIAQKRVTPHVFRHTATLEFCLAWIEQ